MEHPSPPYTKSTAQPSARPLAAANFAGMTYEQQVAAIRSLAASGYGDHEIARLAQLHVEQVRRLLAPDTEQAELHAAGHGVHDIATALGMHPEQIRRWLQLDVDEAAAAHAQRWQERT